MNLEIMSVSILAEACVPVSCTSANIVTQINEMISALTCSQDMLKMRRESIVRVRLQAGPVCISVLHERAKKLKILNACPLLIESQVRNGSYIVYIYTFEGSLELM